MKGRSSSKARVHQPWVRISRCQRTFAGSAGAPSSDPLVLGARGAHVFRVAATMRKGCRGLHRADRCRRGGGATAEQEV